ncbi:MAG: ribbon-helix-helix domain-containing protein [Burkholderia sp.]
MKAAKKPSGIRFDAAQSERLDALAKTRGVTKASLVREAVDVLLEADAEKTHLDELEARLAATINRLQRDTAGVRNDVQMLFAYVDSLAKFILYSTPEILDKEARKTLGVRRYANLIRETVGNLSGKRSKTAIKLSERTNDE